VERSEKRRNSGRAIAGRGIMERIGVGVKGGRIIRGRGTRHEGAGRRWEGWLGWRGRYQRANTNFRDL